MSHPEVCTCYEWSIQMVVVHCTVSLQDWLEIHVHCDPVCSVVSVHSLPVVSIQCAHSEPVVRQVCDYCVSQLATEDMSCSTARQWSATVLQWFATDFQLLSLVGVDTVSRYNKISDTLVN